MSQGNCLYNQISTRGRYLRCYPKVVLLIRSITALDVRISTYRDIVTASTGVAIMGAIENKHGNPAVSKLLLMGGMPADTFLLTSLFALSSHRPD